MQISLERPTRRTAQIGTYVLLLCHAHGAASELVLIRLQERPRLAAFRMDVYLLPHWSIRFDDGLYDVGLRLYHALRRSSYPIVDAFSLSRRGALGARSRNETLAIPAVATVLRSRHGGDRKVKCARKEFGKAFRRLSVGGLNFYSKHSYKHRYYIETLCSLPTFRFDTFFLHFYAIIIWVFVLVEYLEILGIIPNGNVQETTHKYKSSGC